MFSLEDDQGGSSVQCRKCGLLNDVPQLSELSSLANDGTYKLDERPSEPQGRSTRLSDLAHSFSIDGEDANGTEIDLRLTPQQIAAVGAPPPAKAPPPRYDPETGELIRPLELSARRIVPEQTAEIPFAQPAVTYSTSPALPAESLRGSVRVLCMPVNVVVIATVLAVQIVVTVAFDFTIASGLMIGTAGLFIVQLLLIAHYGNVIDEAGVEERDDLPRLFRDLRLHEDIWSPLLGMLGGTFLCYAPALICLMAASMSREAFLKTSDILLLLAAVLGVCIVMISVLNAGIANIDWAAQVVRPLAMILVALVVSFVPAGICLMINAPTSGFFAVALIIALAGTYFLPGVLLTLMTSGSVVNLCPDRVLKTIGLCGPRYFSPLLAWIVAAAGLGLGQTILAFGVDRWANGRKTGTWLDQTLLSYPLLCLGIIVMHYCCFELGMLYRRHHAAFPWLFQRHEPVNHPRRAAAIRSATTSRAGRVLRK
jgi:hypothetical protein